MPMIIPPVPRNVKFLFMNVVTMVAAFLLGVGLVGRGLWVKARGGPVVIRRSGRTWRTPGRAAAFWALIGCGLLSTGFLWLGGLVGIFGGQRPLVADDVAFWFGLAPPAFCAVALLA